MPTFYDIIVYLQIFINNEKKPIKNRQCNYDSIVLATHQFVEELMVCYKPKFVYNNLINKIANLPLQKNLKLEKCLDIEIVVWSEYFDSYLVYNFQYKFLHRIIPTNSFCMK